MAALTIWVSVLEKYLTQMRPSEANGSAINKHITRQIYKNARVKESVSNRKER